MLLIRHFRILLLGIAICYFAFPRISIGEEPSLSGEFPFDGVLAVYSGPFTQLDRSDLLVLHSEGGIEFENYDYTGAGIGMGTLNLALYSFDGSEFHKIWKNQSVMLQYSLPRKYPITRTAWCCGDFDNDGRYSLITCNVHRMWEYTFDKQLDEQYIEPSRKLIKTPEVWIDQFIACDIDGDSCDELVALEYLNLKDSSGTYHIGIYKIVGKSLVKVWRGLDGQVGGNYEIVPPTSFISKCRIDGIPGEVPVLKASQSDMSLSNYYVIGKGQTGDYKIIRPFPIPQRSHLKKGERGAREEHERLTKSRVGPVGGVIFNDGNKILHYGFFHDPNAPNLKHKPPDQFSFSVLDDDHWRLLKKYDPSIGGLLCRFTIDAGKSGWLFIKGQKYFFYDALPLIN